MIYKKLVKPLQSDIQCKLVQWYACWCLCIHMTHMTISIAQRRWSNGMDKYIYLHSEKKTMDAIIYSCSHLNYTVLLIWVLSTINQGVFPVAPCQMFDDRLYWIKYICVWKSALNKIKTNESKIIWLEFITRIEIMYAHCSMVDTYDLIMYWNMASKCVIRIRELKYAIFILICWPIWCQINSIPR